MKPTRQQIDRWLRQANRDFQAAQRQLQVQLWEQCALLCEQAVEKYLKALHMHSTGREAPRTHKIAEFGEELGVPDEFSELLQQLEADYMTTRYPDVAVAAPFEAYTEQIARERLEGTGEVIQWIKQQMNLSD